MKSTKKTAKPAKVTTAKKTTSKKTGTKKTSKKTETTHIIAVLDRSASMRPVAKEAIEGYNIFIDAQKKLKGKATLSGTLFDDQFDPLYDGKILDIKDVPTLTDAVFVPRGMTALYDAIGKTVNHYKSEQANVKKGKKADKVLMIIVTDGANNASKEFSRTDIADLITFQKKQNWQFVFLCSTEDAVTVGASLGVSGGNTFKFENTGAGNTKMYAKLSRATEHYRGMSLQDKGYVEMSANLLVQTDETEKV